MQMGLILIPLNFIYYIHHPYHPIFPFPLVLIICLLLSYNILIDRAIILSLNSKIFIMSFSSHKISNSNPSSQKKKTLDRFIPHSVAKNLFNTPLHHTHQTQYEELLNQNLLTQNAPKILHFH